MLSIFPRKINNSKNGILQKSIILYKIAFVWCLIPLSFSCHLSSLFALWIKGKDQGKPSFFTRLCWGIFHNFTKSLKILIYRFTCLCLGEASWKLPTRRHDYGNLLKCQAIPFSFIEFDTQVQNIIWLIKSMTLMHNALHAHVL